MTATLATSGTQKKPVDRQELSTRLLGSAAKKSHDPVVDIDWAAPIPDDLYGLSPEWSTLYGTPLTRATSQIHVVEEARHMRFARDEIAPAAPPSCRAGSSACTGPSSPRSRRSSPRSWCSRACTPRSDWTPRRPGRPRANDHYAARLREAAAGLVRFLRDVGLVGGPSELLWRHATLV